MPVRTVEEIDLNVIKTYSRDRLFQSAPSLYRLPKDELAGILDRFDMVLFTQLMNVYSDPSSENSEEYKRLAAQFLEKTQVPALALNGAIVWCYGRYYMGYE